MANEIYELVITGQAGMQFVENVLHFDGGNLTADDTFDNGESLLSSWVANIQAKWLACLPADYSLERISARRATPKPSQVRSRQYQPGSTPGTRSGNVVTNQLCPSIFLIPTMGTKTGGKVFMPAVASGDILNNQYVAGYLTAITSLFNTMITNFGVSGKTWQLAVYSRKLKTFSLVVGFTASGRFGFQKKRRVPV
jgi:hypothetical protein